MKWTIAAGLVASAALMSSSDILGCGCSQDFVAPRSKIR
jgi:hypothetical protein